MKILLVKIHKAVLAYALWGWPLVLLDAGLDAWLGEPMTWWRHVLNDGGFAYVLCAAAALLGAAGLAGSIATGGVAPAIGFGLVALVQSHLE